MSYRLLLALQTVNCTDREGHRVPTYCLHGYRGDNERTAASISATGVEGTGISPIDQLISDCCRLRNTGLYQHVPTVDRSVVELCSKCCSPGNCQRVALPNILDCVEILSMDHKFHPTTGLIGSICNSRQYAYIGLLHAVIVLSSLIVNSALSNSCSRQCLTWVATTWL